MSIVVLYPHVLSAVALTLCAVIAKTSASRAHIACRHQTVQRECCLFVRLLALLALITVLFFLLYSGCQRYPNDVSCCLFSGIEQNNIYPNNFFLL